MELKDLFIKTVRDHVNRQDRSNQKQIGVSEIGGCRRKVWHRLQQTPKLNPDVRLLPSFMGTAIHAAIQEMWDESGAFGDILLETEWEAEGIKGHIDYYNDTTGQVIDWKTTKLSNLGFFPSKQQRWQVQVYGWLLAQNGKTVHEVSLLGIARDGDEYDIVVHTEAYDETVALQAVSWYRDMLSRTEAPEPEKDVTFCARYCDFYDPKGEKGCPGLRAVKDVADVPAIIDDTVIDAADEFVALNAQIKELEARRDGAKEALEGAYGMTPTGLVIKWSEVAGRSSVDEQAVEKAMGFVPKKQGKGYPRLTVKGV